MTNREWNALQRMHGLNWFVAGIGNATVNAIEAPWSDGSSVRVTYYDEHRKHIVYFSKDDELTANDKAILRKLYDNCFKSIVPGFPITHDD